MEGIWRDCVKIVLFKKGGCGRYAGTLSAATRLQTVPREEEGLERMELLCCNYNQAVKSKPYESKES